MRRSKEAAGRGAAGRLVPPVRLYWHRLAGQPGAMVGTAIFLVFLLFAVFGPWLAPFSYVAQDIPSRLQPPSWLHLFGTDQYGRDVLSRVIVGSRSIFGLGGTGTVLAVVLGTSIGLVSGYVGRWWDEAIMRILDVFLAIPSLLLALVLLATVGPSPLNLVLVVTLLYLPIIARVARSMALSLRTSQFVEAAKLRGESSVYILFREILPNSLAPLLVETSVRFSYSIFLVASLGFLGLGVQAPSPDWGLQINEARNWFTQAPWMLLFPAAAIALLVIGSSLMTDGLRHIFLPRVSSRTGTGQVRAAESAQAMETEVRR